jgi:predicted P-loop ATPase
VRDNVKDLPLDADDFERVGDTKKIKDKSQRNISVALGLLGARVSYNEFSDRMLVEGLDGFSLLDDAAVERLWFQIDESFKFLPPRDFFFSALRDLARSNRFHPVREYLGGLKWDGARRVDNWLARYAGAEDSEYTRAVGRLMLIAAVRRVRHPGCKFDEMVVLEGPQGNLKSTLLQTLAVDEEWFSDDLPLGADAKKFIEQARGRWIIEASEMKGLRRTELDHLKAMLSRTHDRARLSYDRMQTELARHSIIVGTTNDAQYLRDLTGNRRFWPVAVGKIDIEKLKADLDQLWAEAAMLEEKGESIRLDQKLWDSARAEQQKRVIEEPWIDTLAQVLGDMTGKILVIDVWAILDLPTGQQTQIHNERLGSAMRSLGWERARLRFQGDKQYCYVRGEGTLRPIQIRRDHEQGKSIAKASYGSDADPATRM